MCVGERSSSIYFAVFTMDSNIDFVSKTDNVNFSSAYRIMVYLSLQQWWFADIFNMLDGVPDICNGYNISHTSQLFHIDKYH